MQNTNYLQLDLTINALAENIVFSNLFNFTNWMELIMKYIQVYVHVKKQKLYYSNFTYMMIIFL